MRGPSIAASLAFLLSLGCTAAETTSHDLAWQVGHHVIFSYHGLEPPSHLFDLIKQGKVGGVIFFGENVSSNLSSTVDALQNAHRQSPRYHGAPLLIMTDEEGGRVARLPGGPVSAKMVGQSSDPSAAATQAGNLAANALHAYHVNTNLAPVLGVYREEGDFLDAFGRSFGNTSDLVTECSTAFILAQQGAGAIATAKHFPGLGAAPKGANTDLQPVTIDLSLDELRSVDEAPYTSAIAAGVDMVMNSWAVYPALDPNYPSGLSTAWVQGELRGRLGFKGVTITDAIEAGSLAAFGDDATRGVLATQAGMDIILASARNVTQGESIVDALVSALQDGTVDADSFAQATDRILALRMKLADSDSESD